MTPNSTIPDRMAWQVVFVTAAALFIIFGIRLSFSVFFAEFVSAEGWSSAAGSSIFSVSMLAFSVAAPPTGILLDRFGPRWVFTGGATLLGLGLLLSSRAQTIEQLIIAYGVISGLGLGVVGLGPMAGNLTGWIPPARRGRAIGIAFAGTGLGSLVFVPLSERLIALFEWRTAYLILSLICFGVLVPMMLFAMRKPPQSAPITRQSNERARWQTLLKHPLFWVLMLVALMAMGPLRSLTVHQVAYMESVGVERATAARYVGLAGFITTGAFIGWGVISDRFGRGWAFTLGALCLSGAVGMLLILRNVYFPLLLIGYATLYALGEGTRSSQVTAIASDTFQNNGLGLVNSLVGAMFGLGAAFGPWAVGQLRDQYGSYIPGMILIIAMIVISIIGFVTITSQRRRNEPSLA